MKEVEITNCNILNSQICIDLFNTNSMNIKIHDNSKLSVNSPQGSNIMAAAIRANNFASQIQPPIFEIYNNQDITSNGWYGIYLSGLTDARIYDNTIYMNRPNYDFFSATQYGIRLEGCSDSKVSCNSLQGNSDNQLTGKTLFSTSYSPRTVLQCNSFDLGNKAMEYLGDCNNSVIKGNTIDYNTFGIYIGNEDLGANGIPGEQLADGSGIAPGNRYQGEATDGIFAESALYRYDNSASPSQIDFAVVNNTSTDYWTPVSNNSNVVGGEVVLVNATTAYTCGTCIPVTAHSDDFNEEKRTSYEKIVQDTVTDTPEKFTLDYKLKLKLYYELKDDPEKQDSSTILQDFYEDYLLTDKNNFYRVDSIIKILADSAAQADSATRTDLIEFAVNINENISTSNDVEVYNKLINYIVLNTVLKDSFELDSTQAKSVYDLATLCPFIAGPAVYIARAIYSLVDENLRFNEEDYCFSSSRYAPPNSSNIVSNHLSVISMKLHPNPAKDLIMISIQCDSKAKIRILDISGKTVIKELADIQSGAYEISTSSLVPGIYAVVLQSKEGLQIIRKLVVMY